MATLYKTIDDITRTKTSVDGTERIPARDSSGDFKITVANFQASLTAPSTYFTNVSYVVLDDDNYERIEVDTTAGDITITLPLKANNLKRRIEIANVKGGTNKVIIAPNATDANKLSGDALAAIWLPKIGDFVTFQESAGSGYWEIVNERITSQLRLNTYAGYGNASNNKIPYFTNTVENVGNMHTLTSNNNTTGCVLTINKSGKYAFTLLFQASASAQNFGTSLNSDELTTNIGSINVLHRMSYCAISGNEASSLSFMMYLSKNNILRPHTDGTVPASAARCALILSYLGN